MKNLKGRKDHRNWIINASGVVGGIAGAGLLLTPLMGWRLGFGVPAALALYTVFQIEVMDFLKVRLFRKEIAEREKAMESIRKNNEQMMGVLGEPFRGREAEEARGDGVKKLIFGLLLGGLIASGYWLNRTRVLVFAVLDSEAQCWRIIENFHQAPKSVELVHSHEPVETFRFRIARKGSGSPGANN
jgi:hypothetical protein